MSAIEALYVKRIKIWKAGGSGNPPSLIPALWYTGILYDKQATQTKHFDSQCILKFGFIFIFLHWQSFKLDSTLIGR